MNRLQKDIKECKSQEELYELLKITPKVYQVIFRRDILSEFAELKTKKK